MRYLYNIIVLLLLIAGVALVVFNFAHFGNVEWTDNAHVCQHVTPQNTRVQGFIREIRFEEFQKVKKGDTLVVIEDAEFRLRLAQAEADLARAEESAKQAGSSIETTDANMTGTEAMIAEARATMDNAKREDERYAKLLAKEAVTQQQYDNVHTAYLASKARYEHALSSHTAQVGVKREKGHILSSVNSALEVAKAAVQLARLNLSYCYILATCDGVVGRKEIQEGTLVQPGQTMVDIVANDEIWVVANYRESQLHNIHVGARVSIKADAVPDVEFSGTVERISEATGSAYSLIPQDNATGNFVKVEQRVPVRISLEHNSLENLKRLCAGMNVECEVKVGSADSHRQK